MSQLFLYQKMLRKILCRRLLSTASQPASPKPFHEIPGPSEYPILGSFIDLAKEKAGYHIFYKNLHDKYGEIVRFSIFDRQIISISGANMIKEVYASNQSAPLRETLDFWVMYRKSRNLPLGVTMQLSQLDQDEAEWRRFRKPIAKLLRPAYVSTCIPRVSQIALDLANTLRQSNQSPLSVDTLSKVTSAYGFEAICSILMGKSLGVLGLPPGDINPKAHPLLDSVDRMFRSSNKMLFKELPLWKYFKTATRKDHDRAWDDVFSHGRTLYQSRHVDKDPRFVNDGTKDFFEILNEVDPDETEEQKLTDDERTVIGVELLAAGVDTTSNATQWVLYCMAHYPEVQERLAKTLVDAMGPSSTPVAITEEVMTQTQLLPFVEECLRLYPVLPVGSRMFAKDVVLCGYHIPAFTQIALNNYVSSRDARNFKDPDVFDETRSIRRECPFGSKTFGAGSRQCKDAFETSLERINTSQSEVYL
jgi:cytochrome P450